MRALNQAVSDVFEIGRSIWCFASIVLTLTAAFVVGILHDRWRGIVLLVAIAAVYAQAVGRCG